MPRAQAHILELQPYVPGKAIRTGSSGTPMLKLGSNESPLGPSPSAIAVIQAIADKLHLYPDDAAVELKGALAELNGISPDQIILGAGSDEVIAMALHTFCGPTQPITTAIATFPMYGICARSFGASVHYRSLAQHGFDLAAYRDVPADSIVCIADPNNPTGTLVDFEALLSLVTYRPDVLFLYDAAYEEYRMRPAQFTWGPILSAHRNLFVTRTFSKAYGLAGLRIGYGYGHPDLVESIRRVRPPFNVNALALAAAEASVKDTLHLKQVQSTNTQSLAQLETFFAKQGLTFVKSYANFALVQMPTIVALPGETIGQAWARQLLAADIIVRALPAIGYDDWLRITTGTMAQTQRVCDALSSLLARVH